MLNGSVDIIIKRIQKYRKLLVLRELVRSVTIKTKRFFFGNAQNGKGFCLPHLGQLIEVAAEELNAKELGEFIRMVTDVETKNLDRIQEDISWFIKKFDYRFEGDSWKNSKDAVERTVNKTRGWCVGKEPNE